MACQALPDISIIALRSSAVKPSAIESANTPFRKFGQLRTRFAKGHLRQGVPPAPPLQAAVHLLESSVDSEAPLSLKAKHQAVYTAW